MDIGNETMLRRMIVVKRFGEQRGNSEELYKSVGSNKVYIRQDIRDDEHVVWYTASKWQGGYEADAPLKAGIIICVYDQNDIELYVETTEPAPNGSWAKKRADFVWEVESKLVCWSIGRFALSSHRDWAAWLMGKNDQNVERDNWLYFFVETVSKTTEYLETHVGRKYTIVREDCRHQICGETWSAYLLIDELGNIADICGYRFADQSEFDCEGGENGI